MTDSIRIIKGEVGIKFYCDEGEPLAIIYNNSPTALVRDVIVTEPGKTSQLSQMLMLVGVFLKCLQGEKEDRSRKQFDVLYVNEPLGVRREARYSPKQLLRWLYSDEIITVDKKNRVRFEFKTFNYKDDIIIINYNPVVW